VKAKRKDPPFMKEPGRTPERMDLGAGLTPIRPAIESQGGGRLTGIYPQEEVAGRGKGAHRERAIRNWNFLDRNYGKRDDSGDQNRSSSRERERAWVTRREARRRSWSLTRGHCAGTGILALKNRSRPKKYLK